VDTLYLVREDVMEIVSVSTDGLGPPSSDVPDHVEDLLGCLVDYHGIGEISITHSVVTFLKTVSGLTRLSAV
jgi:hypothetical protein